MLAGCGSGGEGGPEPSVVTYNSIRGALEQKTQLGAKVTEMECGSEVEELEASSVEEAGLIGGCTATFENAVGWVRIPYTVELEKNWCFTLEIPMEGFGLEGSGSAPEIKGSSVAESAGAEAAGGVLGNVSGCVHPKPES
jgi:hypothetical protein